MKIKNCYFKYLVLSNKYLFITVFVPIALGKGSSEHIDKKQGTGENRSNKFKVAEKFPSTSYKESMKIRSTEKPLLPSDIGNPSVGKKLAFTKKGQCLNCHILGPDSDQAGNLGPNLSSYSKLGRTDAYTFQNICDPRSYNPNTIMPPYGTNEILKKQEVIHIVAYLNTL